MRRDVHIPRGCARPFRQEGMAPRTKRRPVGRTGRSYPIGGLIAAAIAVLAAFAVVWGMAACYQAGLQHGLEKGVEQHARD